MRPGKTTDYVNLGDVIREQLGEQCQYGSRYADPSKKEYLAEGLRVNGRCADYHSMEIHKDDVKAFVERVKNVQRFTSRRA